jgi:glycosyltransferase involved in cell wall biosynthesis
VITILITTYNNGSTLCSSIYSVLNQDYNNYELLIVDDGSEDQTRDVVGMFDDKRISYYKISHQGRSSALNYGLKTARYDWVSLLDADDLIVPWKLSRLISYIGKSCDRTIISCNSVVFRNKRLLSLLNYPANPEEIKKHLLVHSINNSVTYNRHFIISEGGYRPEVSRAEDYDLWLRLYDKAEYKVIPEVLTFHRYHTQSYSRKNISFTNQQIRLIQSENNIHLLDARISNVNERILILLRRTFYYGYDKSHYHGKYLIKYLLLYIISNIPESIADKIRGINIRGIIRYYSGYFNKELINLRKIYGEIITSGDSP